MSALKTLEYLTDDYGNAIESHLLSHGAFVSRYYFFNGRL